MENLSSERRAPEITTSTDRNIDVPLEANSSADALNVRAVRESKERYRTVLFELAPVAVYSCDASGVIRDYNFDRFRQADSSTRRKLLGGFQIHVPKPVDPDHLIAVVANLTAR